MTFWKNLSLRIKISILYIGLLALILAILGATFFFDTKNLLITKTASDLRARAKPIIEEWLYRRSGNGCSGCPGIEYLFSISKELARDLTSKDTVAIIIDEKGEIIANGRILSEEPISPDPIPRYYNEAFRGNNEVTYIVSQDGYHTLVVLIPLRENPRSRKILGVVQLSSPLTELEEVLKTHSIKLIIGIVITLILGSLLGFLIVTSSLKRLNRMIDVCEDISKGNFGKRVNLTHYKDEVGKLAGAFDKMIVRIESTLEAQKRFIANAAHELRTPLTAIRGSIEVLLRGAQDNPAMVKRLSRTIYREVQRLSRLCDTLLDLSKLDSYTAINKKEIILNDFFNNLISEMVILAGNKKIVYSEGPYVRMNIDSDLLKQALINLVDNSVKYTDENGVITIGWELTSGGVRLFVKDNGPGIAKHDIPHIFEPFYRGRILNGITKVEGTGLGLTAVKTIVKAHGGKIEVDTKEGEGAAFYIELPIE